MVRILWMVTTWLLIKTSMEKVNGIFTSGTTLLYSIEQDLLRQLEFEEPIND